MYDYHYFLLIHWSFCKFVVLIAFLIRSDHICITIPLFFYSCGAHSIVRIGKASCRPVFEHGCTKLTIVCQCIWYISHYSHAMFDFIISDSLYSWRDIRAELFILCPLEQYLIFSYFFRITFTLLFLFFTYSKQLSLFMIKNFLNNYHLFIREESFFCYSILQIIQ